MGASVYEMSSNKHGLLYSNFQYVVPPFYFLCIVFANLGLKDCLSKAICYYRKFGIREFERTRFVLRRLVRCNTRRGLSQSRAKSSITACIR